MWFWKNFIMLKLNSNKLREYLSSIYNTDVEILKVGELGGKKQSPEKELKGFGYGVPYLIELAVKGEKKKVVLETMKPEGFGHDFFSDRAGILLWQHSAFGKLPKHVSSVDVGAFTTDGSLKSVGDCTEFFVVTNYIEGNLYHSDLDRIRETERVTKLDKNRCTRLSDYLVQIHSLKKTAPHFYARRIRDLLGHGEGIMGLLDSYPPKLGFVDEKILCEIEKKCVEWRWKLKPMSHRCSQVHGDFHPWNIMFRKGVGFTVLDRSRGEWGEPADDISAMSVNYLFYGLQKYGKLGGSFKALWDLFWMNYLDKTGDEEMLKVVQPYFAWRGLVIASPIWYPDLSLDIRTKLINFIKNVLTIEYFDLDEIDSYLKD